MFIRSPRHHQQLRSFDVISTLISAPGGLPGDSGKSGKVSQSCSRACRDSVVPGIPAQPSLTNSVMKSTLGVLNSLALKYSFKQN